MNKAVKGEPRRRDVARHASSRGAARPVCLVACIAALTGCGEAETPVEDPPKAMHASSGYLRVEITDEIVTIEAREASLKDLVEEIARQSGLQAVLHDPLEARVTLELRRLPLREALGSILRDRSFALQHIRSSSIAGGKPGDAGTWRLWVFSSDVRPAVRVDSPGALDADVAIATLAFALADDDAKVRLEAVAALADAGSDQAAAALATAALSDGDSSVREEAVHAMGEIGGDIGIQVLERALMDSDADVREAAVEAFAAIGGNESALALADVLNSGDASLRAAAVDALGEIGGEPAVGLLRHASADEHSIVREAAQELLAELSSKER